MGAGASGGAVRLALLLLGLLAPVVLFAQSYPGGFLETQGSAGIRAKYTVAEINAFVPATRGAFDFPAPYSTRGIRLTQPSDCGGLDCVNYIAYSYWANINNHVNDPDLLVVVGFDVARGGTGMNLLRVNKTTEAVTVLGFLFNPGPYRNMNCSAGCYFSGTQPDGWYFIDDVQGSQQLLRMHVLSGTFETVWDIRDGTVAGCNGTTCPFKIFQPHSSVDDAYHSMTLQDSSGVNLGCIVRKTSAPTVTRYYPKVQSGNPSAFDECALSKDGRYTISLEFVDGDGEIDNRYFDNTTGAEVLRYVTPLGSLGHMETGYTYILGADNFNPLPNATIRWDLSSSPTQGPLVHQNNNFNILALNHLSHLNAVNGAPLAQQMACGSYHASYNLSPYDMNNEITCVRLDGSSQQLIVAPVLTDPNRPACLADQYTCMPKGNIDVTGHYFIWTTNLGGDRLDAFLVKVPSDVLIGGGPVLPIQRWSPSVNLRTH